jgi:hypothetical protein
VRRRSKSCYQTQGGDAPHRSRRNFGNLRISESFREGEQSKIAVGGQRTHGQQESS